MGTIATKSKKAARIESALLNKLALMGQKTFARAMGVHCLALVMVSSSIRLTA